MSIYLSISPKQGHICQEHPFYCMHNELCSLRLWMLVYCNKVKSTGLLWLYWATENIQSATASYCEDSVLGGALLTAAVTTPNTLALLVKLIDVLHTLCRTRNLELDACGWITTTITRAHKTCEQYMLNKSW